jgi:hypothetical protein
MQELDFALLGHAGRDFNSPYRIDLTGRDEQVLTYMILIGVRSAVAPDFRVSAATVPCAD